MGERNIQEPKKKLNLNIVLGQGIPWTSSGKGFGGGGKGGETQLEKIRIWGSWEKGRVDREGVNDRD